MCDCTDNSLVVEYKPIDAGTQIKSGKILFKEDTVKNIKSVLDIVQITALIAGGVILLILFIIYLLNACNCNKGKDRFLSGYDAELEIFTKLIPEARQDYLNMSRAEKLQKYPQLI
jgi:hypothetical protein